MLKRPQYLLLAATLTLLLFAIPVAAKQLYKYQDENGVWHFSDRPPKTDLPVEVRPLNVEPKPRLDMRQVGTEQAPEYEFTNNFSGPLEVEVAFRDAKNIRSDPPLPARFVLEPKETRLLIKVTAADPGKAWEFQLSYRWVPGDPGMQHEPGVLYVPPFPAGETFRLTQGFNDEKTHTTPDSSYAVDIALPEGTPVLAARSGVVMDVEDDFFKSGTSREQFADRANVIRILHADGTMAIYAHLQLDSVRVRAGSVVLAGEQIASSGNTGYSSGPHLHFAIQRNAGMALESVPFSFMSSDTGSFRPENTGVIKGVTLPVEYSN